MKNYFAYKHGPNNIPETIGDFVSNQYCLCIDEECRVETILSMMVHMRTRVAAIVSTGNIFQGLVARSALLGGLKINADFNVGQAIDTGHASALRAGDVMIRAEYFLPSELSPHEALEIMVESGHHTLPVLEDNAHFVGIAERHKLEHLIYPPMPGQIPAHATRDLAHGAYSVRAGH